MVGLVSQGMRGRDYKVYWVDDRQAVCYFACTQLRIYFVFQESFLQHPFQQRSVAQLYSFQVRLYRWTPWNGYAYP